MKTTKRLIALAMSAVMSCTALTATASATWVNSDKGVMWQNADGTYAKSKWITMKSGSKYYIKSNGTRATGLLAIKNKQGGKDYYYFDEKGVMQTGWQNVKGNVYYFTADGKAAVTTQVIGDYAYKFSSEGVWDGKVYSKDGKKDVTSKVAIKDLVPVATTGREAEYGKVKTITGKKPATVTINGLTYRTDADNNIAGKKLYVFSEGNEYTRTYINIANCTDADLECLKYMTDIEDLRLVTCPIEDMLQKENANGSALWGKGGYQTPAKITNLDFCYFMPNLKYVTINNAPYLSDVSGLSVCKNLQDITFRNCGIKNLDGLEEVKTIKEFEAFNTRLENLDGLQNCKSIKSVSITQSYLTDISGLKDKTKLRLISIRRTRRLTDITPIATCKNATEVNMSGCNSVMDWSALKELSKLKIYGIKGASKRSNAVQVRDALKKRGIQFGIFDALEFDAMADAPHSENDLLDYEIYWDREMLDLKDIYAKNYPCTCSYCKKHLYEIANWTGEKDVHPAVLALGTYQN